MRCFLSLSFVAASAWGMGCSSASSIVGAPQDGGAGADASVDPTKEGGLGAQAIPDHVFAVHAAHMQAFSIGDVRLCPSADAVGARPNENRIPRANYPGVVRGGFAEILNPGAWTAPFALDAYGLGMAESQKPIPCTQLDGDFYVKARLAPVMLAKPGIVAIVDGQGDAGSDGGVTPELLSIPIASMTTVPAFQIVNVSRDLVTPRLVVRQGKLDGNCSPGDLYDGQGTYGAALNMPGVFTRPTGDFDGSGIQVCTTPLNGTPTLVISRSWAELQAASIPEMVPGDFYAQNALFVIVLMGEKASADPASQLHVVMIPFDVTK